MLPYGLQKRVELGRALALNPEVLLLDEPLAGLNLEEVEDMARFILDINEEKRWRVTCILVEHDMGVVMDISHQCVCPEFWKPDHGRTSGRGPEKPGGRQGLPGRRGPLLHKEVEEAWTDSGIEITKDLTIPKLFLRQCRKYGRDKVAMREKEFGIWRPFTWQDYYENVKYLCLGMVDLGLKKGDKVAMIGDNRPEGLWAEMAAMCAGGIGVWLFQDCMMDEVRVYHRPFGRQHFWWGKAQEEVDKALSIKDQCPKLEMDRLGRSQGNAELPPGLSHQHEETSRNWAGNWNRENPASSRS